MSKRGTRLNSSLLIPCEYGTTSIVSVSRARTRERAREFVFFFKQKTAYEIMPSLVGSEMCIRDSF